MVVRQVMTEWVRDASGKSFARDQRCRGACAAHGYAVCDGQDFLDLGSALEQAARRGSTTRSRLVETVLREWLAAAASKPPTGRTKAT